MTSPPPPKDEKFIQNTEDVIDYRNTKLGRLLKFAGTYNYAAILNDRHVAARLKEIMGPRLGHLFENLGVLGPVGLIRGSQLELIGNRPHEGMTERAIVLVSVISGEVEAAIYSHGKKTVYSKRRGYTDLSGTLKLWIHAAAVNRIIRRPPETNFEIEPANAAGK